MNLSMATAEQPSKTSDVRLAALFAVLIGVYSAFSVATFWGALGGLSGAVGTFLSVWILKQRPGRPTLFVAAVALVLNLLAFAVAGALVLAVVIGKV
jgi:hypothetical protein